MKKFLFLGYLIFSICCNASTATTAINPLILRPKMINNNSNPNDLQIANYSDEIIVSFNKEKFLQAHEQHLMIVGEAVPVNKTTVKMIKDLDNTDILYKSYYFKDNDLYCRIIKIYKEKNNIKKY